MVQQESERQQEQEEQGEEEEELQVRVAKDRSQSVWACLPSKPNNEIIGEK
jgi:hypothetical protein